MAHLSPDGNLTFPEIFYVSLNHVDQSFKTSVRHGHGS